MNNKDNIFQCLRILFPFNLKGQSGQTPILSSVGPAIAGHQQNEHGYHYLRLAFKTARTARYEGYNLKYP